MRTIKSLSAILALTISCSLPTLVHAATADSELPQCSTEQDAQTGCIKIITQKGANGQDQVITMPYREGKKNGLATIKDTAGHLIAEYPMVNDKYEGVVKEFFPNGDVSAEYTYHNGILNGAVKRYNAQTHKLETESMYVNNIKNGIEKTYFVTGALKSEVPFKNNAINGEVKIYNLGGWLESDGFFKNGLAEGEAKKFNKDGTVSEIGFFKNGKQQGHFEQYSYCTDAINGTQDPNGNEIKCLMPKIVIVEGNYKNDKLDGPLTRRYLYSGVLKSTENYNNGLRNGDFVYYNRDGSPYYTLHYENDKLVAGSKDGKDLTQDEINELQSHDILLELN